jgi:glutamate N-acetyltransferase/amino-acid N-acetyltransferase
LGVSKNEVLVASTGVIGRLMDMKPLVNGMGKLVKGLSHDGLIDAADGIMTTDRFRKVSTRVFTIGTERITMTGVAKGAGMIDPNMATMLCFILTDADISHKALKKALSDSVDTSFNAITVDGDMSTNDTVMLLANGQAGNRKIEGSGKDFEIFLENLNAVSKELAAMIIQDGEGASKFIEVKVKGARTKNEAKQAAEAVSNSLLVKCAVLGGDPNWGRVASSVGASGIDFNPGRMEIVLDGVTFFKSGKVASEGKRKAASVFKKKNVHIEVNLHHGKAEADFHTCDISKRYITLNSYYTT